MGKPGNLFVPPRVWAEALSPRDRAIVEALYGTGARVEELVQLRRRQLVPDLEGSGGYATLYGKHGGRTIRVGRRTWKALESLAEDERIRQILTAAAATAGLQKKDLATLAAPRARLARPSTWRAPAATVRDTLGHAR